MNIPAENNLSVIVITRNRLDKLKRCLQSVASTLPQSEIIVVDNGSIDGTAQFLRDHLNASEHVSIFMDTNVGVAAARNIGVAKSSKKFILFLDDDAWIESLDFAEIQAYFEGHPEVGIIAPRLLSPDGSSQESVRSFPTIPAVLWRGSFLSKLFPNAPWYRKYILKDIFAADSTKTSAALSVRQVDWAIGACQIIRRELFDSIGPLDESYFFGYEDIDFCRRLKTARYLTIFWPHARVYHEYTRTSSKGFNRSFVRHGKSILRYFSCTPLSYKGHCATSWPPGQ